VACGKLWRSSGYRCCSNDARGNASHRCCLVRPTSLLSFRIVNDYYRARGGVVWKVQEGEDWLFIRTLTRTPRTFTRGLNGRLVTCDAGIDQTDEEFPRGIIARAISVFLSPSLKYLLSSLLLITLGRYEEERLLNKTLLIVITLVTVAP